ncbi:MAG: heme exporter protein CcmB [Gammaproteobacteria bacterium]
MTVLRQFTTLWKREILLSLRQLHEILLPIIFFVIVVSLFPLAVSPDLQLLHRIGPGIIWIAALLACLLSLSRLLVMDWRDGSLEQFILMGVAPALFAGVKLLNHWVFSGLLLILLTPLWSGLLGLTWVEVKYLMLTLLLGTPILSSLGIIGSALTLGARQANVLLVLLIMPLMVPVLIFGTSAVVAVGLGQVVIFQLALMGALLVISVLLAPWVAGFTLLLML